MTFSRSLCSQTAWTKMNAPADIWSLSVKHSKKQPTNTRLATADELYTHRRHAHNTPASPPQPVTRVGVRNHDDWLLLKEPNCEFKTPPWHFVYMSKEQLYDLGNELIHFLAESRRKRSTRLSYEATTKIGNVKTAWLCPKCEISLWQLCSPLLNNCHCAFTVASCSHTAHTQFKNDVCRLTCLTGE